MDHQRRQLLHLAATAALLAGGSARAASAEVAPALTVPPPGKPGEFDFLTGEWRISHRQLTASGAWITFKGEATVWSILGGVGSIEELRIPERNFSGMGLRLLDLENHVWNDFWVNGRSGVLAPPGLTGGFRDGVGVFEADDRDGDTPIKARGTWDRITPTSCRWWQSVSRDGGRTWDGNWYMDWVRA